MKLAVIHSSLLQLPTVSKFSDNDVFYVFYPYCLPNLAPNIHPSPGQPQDVISPTYPASAPGAPHTKTCLEHLIPLREKISRDTSTLPGISIPGMHPGGKPGEGSWGNMPGGWANGDQRDDMGPPPEGGAVWRLVQYLLYGDQEWGLWQFNVGLLRLAMEEKNELFGTNVKDSKCLAQHKWVIALWLHPSFKYSLWPTWTSDEAP